MTKVAILGIDLAKNVFQLRGVDAEGQPMLRHRVRRGKLLQIVSDIEPCLIAMRPVRVPFTGQAHFTNTDTACAPSVLSM